MTHTHTLARSLARTHARTHARTNAQSLTTDEPTSTTEPALQCSAVVSESDMWTVGDGYCDTLNNANSRACAWDGGDCCLGTCVGDAAAAQCPRDTMVCLDPQSSDYVPSGQRTCRDAISYASWVADGE